MFFRDPFVATELPLSSGSLDQSYLPTPKVPFLFSASSLCPRFFQPPLLFLFPLSPLVVRCPTSALPLPPPCFLGYFNLRLPRQFPFRLPRPFFTPYLPLLQAFRVVYHFSSPPPVSGNPLFPAASFHRASFIFSERDRAATNFDRKVSTKI